MVFVLFILNFTNYKPICYVIELKLKGNWNELKGKLKEKYGRTHRRFRHMEGGRKDQPRKPRKTGSQKS